MKELFNQDGWESALVTALQVLAAVVVLSAALVLVWAVIQVLYVIGSIVMTVLACFVGLVVAIRLLQVFFQ